MKNREWHIRIWKNKMEELPVRTEVNRAWADMQELLDKSMPAHIDQKGIEHGPAKNTRQAGHTAGFVKKLLSVLQYVVPAAAMVTAAGIYFGGHNEEPQNNAKKDVENVVKDIGGDVAENALGNTIHRAEDFADSARSYMDTSLIRPSPAGDAARSGQSVSEPSEGRFRRDQIAIENMPGVVKNVPSVMQNVSGVMQNMSNVVQAVPGVVQSIPVDERRLVDTNSDKIMESTESLFAEQEPLKKRWLDLSWLNGIFIKKERGFRARNGWKGNSTIEPEENSWGILAAASLDKQVTVFPGAFVQLALKDRLGVYTELNLMNRTVMSGRYSHPSFARPDSSTFEIRDSRKIVKLEMPVNVSFKLTNSLRLKAGPVLSYAYRQADIKNIIGPVALPMDTLFKGQYINKSLSESKLGNRLGVGISAGADIHLRRFVLGASYYRSLTPYMISTNLGGYKGTTGVLQFRLGLKISELLR